MTRRIFVDTEWTAPPWSPGAALAAGVEIPPRAANHLHPQVHAEWNRTLFRRIEASRGRP